MKLKLLSLVLFSANMCFAETLIVKVESGKTYNDLSNSISLDGGVIKKTLIPGEYYLVEYPEVSASSAIEVLESQADIVQYAQPDYPIQINEPINESELNYTDDPYLEDQWHLINNGQTGGTAEALFLLLIR